MYRVSFDGVRVRGMCEGAWFLTGGDSRVDVGDWRFSRVDAWFVRVFGKGFRISWSSGRLRGLESCSVES